MSTIAESLAIAVQHHQSGRLQQAEQMYRQILHTNPNHVDALHLLGLVAHQVGNHEVAVEFIGRAIRLNGKVADMHSNLGLAYFAWRKIPEAIASYRRALKLEPNDPKAWMLLGVALKDSGERSEATTCYRRALKLKPDFIEALGNLGNVLKDQGLLDEAIACYRQLLTLKPNIAEAHCNLGAALQNQGRLADAIQCFRRTLELKPTFAEAHGHLGNVLKEQGLLNEAAICFRRALELKPSLFEAHGNLGIVLMDQGWPEDAIASYRRALELMPNDPASLSNLGNALTNRGRLGEAVSCFRRALERKPDDAVAYSNLGTAMKDQGLLDEAIASVRRALELKPDYAPAHSNLLLTLHYRDGITLADLATAHAEFDRQHALPLRGHFDKRPDARARRSRPRLGFVSADFGRHPVGFFLIRVLEHLGRDEFEMFFYSDRKVKDDFTQRFQSVATHWYDAIGMSDTRLAEQIRADGIDILFDLAGHTGHNRILVFARKPAPIQVTWIGYEGTTGLSAMDYLIADHQMIPMASEAHVREKVLRMPDGYLCYEPPSDAPPVGPIPSVANGHTTFGSFNNLAKITPQVVTTWSEILRRLPNARLLMKYNGLGDAAVRQRYLGLFAANGVTAQRLALQGSSTYADYLAAYGHVDVMLDPFPFAGGTTTCEALWMGVPVLTCPFETFASRHSLSHLSNVGLVEMIAKNLDEYVELAVSLSSDTSRLATIRAGLRDRMRTSPLCDGRRFALNFASMLQTIWNRNDG